MQPNIRMYHAPAAAESKTMREIPGKSLPPARGSATFPRRAARSRAGSTAIHTARFHHDQRQFPKP